MIDLDFKGKKAVVTGASLGIGAAVVKMLADQGADVSFCARNQKGVDELAGYEADGKLGTVKGFVADMGEVESTNQFIETIQANGQVDILVNNVGASPSRNFYYLLLDAHELFFLICEKGNGVA